MTNEGQLPSDLFMDLDRSGPMPLYFQVASRIEESIRSGAMPPGARLENEIALGEPQGRARIKVVPREEMIRVSRGE